MSAYLRYIIVFLVFSMAHTTLFAQDIKARLSVDYYKVIGTDGELVIQSKFKGDDGYQPATHLELNVYQEIVEDSLVLIGKTITNEEGEARFSLSALTGDIDSIITHNFVVKIENNDTFKNAKKAVSFMDANLEASIVSQGDSLTLISATLTDAIGDPIAKKKLAVQVKRLFAPLTIGESSYKTDKKGQIQVLIEDSIPSADGQLTFMVIFEHKKYGSVNYIFTAPVGRIIEDQSTFDQRTMWSPPSKTPLFLWIFPNILIFGIWSVILLLVSNLFKIYKS